MILVTGGSGFIGSVLVRTLFERGEQVRVFDIIDFKDRASGIEFVRGDIRKQEDIVRALDGVGTVYHNAALVPLAKAGQFFWDVNVTGTALLLDQCRKHNIKRFVHVSSSAVFGIPQCPITDKSPLRPVEIYGKAKLAGENLVKKYIADGYTATIIRPRTVLGNFRLGVFHILFEWISENKNIYIIGKGNNLFQFVHVDDLVDAMIKSAQWGKSGIFNIGTDRFTTLREDLASFIKEVGSISRVRSLPETIAISTLSVLDWLWLSPLAPWHYLTYCKPFYFDVSYEKEVLKWEPRYSNIEAFVVAYRWYIENKDRLNEEVGQDTSTHHTPPKQRILKLLKWLS